MWCLGFVVMVRVRFIFRVGFNKYSIINKFRNVTLKKKKLLKRTLTATLTPKVVLKFYSNVLV